MTPGLDPIKVPRKIFCFLYSQKKFLFSPKKFWISNFLKTLSYLCNIKESFSPQIVILSLSWQLSLCLAYYYISDLQKVQISNVSWFWMVGFQIPAVKERIGHITDMFSLNISPQVHYSSNCGFFNGLADFSDRVCFVYDRKWKFFPLQAKQIGR